MSNETTFTFHDRTSGYLTRSPEAVMFGKLLEYADSKGYKLAKGYNWRSRDIRQGVRGFERVFKGKKLNTNHFRKLLSGKLKVEDTKLQNTLNKIVGNWKVTKLTDEQKKKISVSKIAYNKEHGIGKDTKKKASKQPKSSKRKSSGKSKASTVSNDIVDSAYSTLLKAMKTDRRSVVKVSKAKEKQIKDNLTKAIESGFKPSRKSFDKVVRRGSNQLKLLKSYEGGIQLAKTINSIK